ncbi:MAG: acyl-CoA thioesterase [Thermosynechococcaceae cyanobacterium]
MYNHTVRLRDTDAAGVSYFTSILEICHDAYEDALATAGIDIRSFFSNPETAIPIVHAAVDFLKPTFCGDQQIIRLAVQSQSETEFEIHYDILSTHKLEQLIGKATTRHVCINPISRDRKPLPAEITTWLQHLRVI